MSIIRIQNSNSNSHLKQVKLQFLFKTNIHTTSYHNHVIRPLDTILGSKLKKNKTRFLRDTGYLNSIKIYKARFIANSSSCTTTELSKFLTSCLTAVKCQKTCEKLYERSGKNLMWSIKNLGKV